METGKATTQTLDRRVERLEIGLAETNRSVDRLELGQQHMKELMTARFATIESNQATTNTKIDALTAYLGGLVTQAQKDQADWKNTPAGKELMDDLDDRRKGREINAERISKAERQLYAVSVVIGLLVIVANILGPIIAKNLVGGP